MMIKLDRERLGRFVTSGNAHRATSLSIWTSSAAVAALYCLVKWHMSTGLLVTD